jgi:NurA-like 5'-3' nuclease
MLMAAHSYNDVETTWQVAKATYPALPPEVKKDVTQQYHQIIQGLYNLKQNCKTIDKNLTRRILIRKRREFLLNNLDKFIEKIHESMAKNNWYTKDIATKPRIAEMPEI